MKHVVVPRVCAFCRYFERLPPSYEIGEFEKGAWMCTRGGDIEDFGVDGLKHVRRTCRFFKPTFEGGGFA